MDKNQVTVICQKERQLPTCWKPFTDNIVMEKHGISISVKVGTTFECTLQTIPSYEDITLYDTKDVGYLTKITTNSWVFH